MSGICGAVMLDGAKADGRALGPVLDALRARGPEGQGQWSGRSLALGHSLLATTPEAATEALPLCHGPSGCVITADVRLDNRGELVERLAPGRRDIGDGELVLLAYLEWNEDCLDHLLGDFAFAIWDARKGRLFAARDPMGMRQLCFAHVPHRIFVFATDPGAVAAHPAIERRVSLARVAECIDGLEGADMRGTFYEGVHRLEAAHCLTLQEGRLDCRRYWRFDPQPELRLKSDAEYAEVLLAELRQAVRPRLRSRTRVGAMLSGGMDSSAICAVAAQILAESGQGPLDTFSVVGPDRTGCVESRAIHDALAIKGIRPHLIPLGPPPELADRLREMGRNLDNPFDALMTLPRAVYTAASDSGINVVVDGIGGDVALTSYTYVARLLGKRKLARAFLEAKGERDYWGPQVSAWKTLGRSAAQIFAPRLWALRSAIKQRRADGEAVSRGRVAPWLAQEAPLAQSRRAMHDRDRQYDLIDDVEMVRQMTSPYLIAGRERYDRVASAVGVEPRDAFLDLRFLRFCASLPIEQLQSNGFPKAVLRRAMAGMVPDAVRWRPGKQHLGQSMNRGILKAGELVHRIDEMRPMLGRLNLRLLNSVEDGVAAQNAAIELLCLRLWMEMENCPIRSLD